MAYHVLVAEDEEVTREAVRAGLSLLLPGASIHAVKNGMEAVNHAKQWGVWDGIFRYQDAGDERNCRRPEDQGDAAGCSAGIFDGV